MKKAILSALVAVALMLPASSYAQTVLEDQYRSYLIQLIELLQARIAELVALQDDMKKTIKEVKEAPAVGGSEPVVEVPVPAKIDVTVGEPMPERDELGRVTFSFSAKTNGEKMRILLERPGGELAINGGLNKETSKNIELRHEYPGIFKWIVTASKGGIETTESGQFEVK